MPGRSRETGGLDSLMGNCQRSDCQAARCQAQPKGLRRQCYKPVASKLKPIQPGEFGEGRGGQDDALSLAGSGTGSGSRGADLIWL